MFEGVLGFGLNFLVRFLILMGWLNALKAMMVDS